MTREEFIDHLEDKKFNYKLVGSKIEISGADRIVLKNILNLYEVEYLPPNVIFSNTGGIKMLNLKNIPEGVEFNNLGPIFLGTSGDGLKIHPLVKFNNGSSISFGFRGYNVNSFDISTEYGGNDIDVEGINTKSLFKLMVRQGVFS